MLELYHSGLTTCSKQVRHCLHEKGLKYESRYVELWRYENLSPAYLKLNPNGVVPTLVHDGVPVINSFCINEYIEDVFPDPPLRPADPHARARELSDADQDFMLEHTPVPDKRERWRILAKEGYTAEQIEEALGNVLFVFGR